MATRKVLGRGLSALIPPPARTPAPVDEPPEESPADDSVPMFVSLSRIAPSPCQPRKVFREADLASLAASIREQGLLQPLVVRRRGDGYELIVGERRWRACRLAGMDEAPVVVLEATDRGVVEMALVENVQRADLNPMELAQAFSMLTEQENMTQEEVGRRVGLERSTIANHLRLLELDLDIQQDLIDQKLTMGHAKAILQVPAEQRRILRDQVIRRSLSVRSTEDLARRVASNAPSRGPRPGPSRDVHIVDLENRLRQRLQTKVRVVGRRGKGRIELHYFGEPELERLADRLLGSES